MQTGDSIAVNGVCLTVIEHTADRFIVDVSRETLNCTEGLEAIGAPVNLEKALRLADRLGGHLVSGHVDGVGEVTGFSDLGESWKLDIRAPQALAKYIAIKGSITINGVSLTVNRVQDDPSGACEFSLNLIPHTLAMTNLKIFEGGQPGQPRSRPDRALCGAHAVGSAALNPGGALCPHRYHPCIRSKRLQPLWYSARSSALACSRMRLWFSSRFLPARLM